MIFLKCLFFLIYVVEGIPLYIHKLFNYYQDILLTKVTTIRVIVEDVQSDQDNINSPPDTTKTSGNKLENTEENVTKIETINT